LQRKAETTASAEEAAASAGTTPKAAVAGALSASGGQPLDPTTRDFFGQRFGRDFGGVRVHTGAEADRSARDLGASAYTVGERIVFRDGEYAPSTESGRHVLGHELAHVVQQAGAEAAPDGSRLADPALESRADAAGVAAARGHGVDAGAVGRTGGGGAGRAQCFGSVEHKELGDVGSGGATYSLPGAVPTMFTLTHGDIVMLSGDYFDPRDTKTITILGQSYQVPVDDSLFKLAGTPSSDPGKQVGTQDEIIYAIYNINSGDPRFAPGGQWNGITFSDAVMSSVHARYLRLAEENKEHFASPNGPLAGPNAGNRSSAGGSYRALHEDALVRAYAAGQAGEAIDASMMREAAAQHFLTDHFASGHLRTPRASIRDFWRGKYPNFWGQLKETIAQRIAEGIDADPRTTGPAAHVGVWILKSKIMPIIDDKTKDKPALGFDDLVAKVAHDVDNQTGLFVVNDLGMQWKAFGDENLHNPDPENRTPQMAELAVKLGMQDVRNAYSLGASSSTAGMSLGLEALGDSVRGMTPSPAIQGLDRYGPEQILPHIDTSMETSTQTWQADTIDALWTSRVRSDVADTYGDRIKAEVSGGEIYHQLSGIAIPQPYVITHFTMPTLGTVPIPYTPFSRPAIVDTPVESTLYPADAYNDRFLKPLVADPLATLKAILSS